MKKSVCAVFLLLSPLCGCDLMERASTVKVKDEPARGLTEHSFDQGYLQNLIEETRQGAEQSLQQAYERNRVPSPDRISHARTQGRYEWLGRRQLAVVDLSYSANPMRVARIVGIANDRLITLSCISPQGEPLDLFNEESDCGRAVKRYFTVPGE